MILVWNSLAGAGSTGIHLQQLMQKDYGVIHLNYLIPSSPVANQHLYSKGESKSCRTHTLTSTKSS